MNKPIRIGQGFDVHAYSKPGIEPKTESRAESDTAERTAGYHIVVGGVRIPHSSEVLAHSDGDVLLHAICDALLGALALGDIGKHFPDTDPRWKNADSRELLEAVMKLVREQGYKLGNLDSTLIAQTPRFAEYIERMRVNIAEDMGASIEQISVKATTTEKLGFTGRGEGIAAQVTLILQHI